MNKLRGFTLIELLSVIAIIGILATVVLVGMNSAQARARDTHRKNHLHQIKGMLEIYYSDQRPNQFKIPSPNPSTANATSTGLTTDYMKNFPTDPKGSSYSQYQYQTDSTGKNFALMAALESSSDPEKKSNVPAALGGGAMTQPYNYWVEND